MGILNIDLCFRFVNIAPIISVHAQIVCACVKCICVTQNAPKERYPQHKNSTRQAWDWEKIPKRILKIINRNEKEIKLYTRFLLF